MAKIFISYRRADSQYQADKLHAALRPYVANPREDIFIDIDNIPLGLDFAEYIDSKVAQAEVLLVLIGHSWLEVLDPNTGRRRLDDPKDFVRIEIASALKRGIPVVPILLDGVSVPEARQLPEELQPLARRNGIPVNRASFDADVARLVRGLPVRLTEKLQTGWGKAAERTFSRRGLTFAAVAAMVFIAGLAVAFNVAASLPPRSSADGFPEVGQGTIQSDHSENTDPDTEEVMDRTGIEGSAERDCSEMEFTLYFEWDSSDLSPSALETLEDAVEKTAGCRTREILISGHTDTSQSVEYSRRLSQRQADAVWTRLADLGVPEAVMSAEGKGASELAVPRPDGVREPLNRRVEIVWLFE